MRADRLLTIVLLLQRRGRQSVVSLSEQLEVSERTILRDMEALGAAGIPIRSVRGPGGGFELVEGFRTDLSTLSEAECGALELLGLPGAAEALGFGDESRNLRLKFGLLISERGRNATTMTAERFFYDEPQLDSTLSERLRFLRDAIWRQRVVVADFEDALARQEFEPLGLVLHRDAWFLVSIVSGQVQVDPVETLSRLSNSGATFERPAGFDLRQGWREWVAASPRPSR